VRSHFYISCKISHEEIHSRQNRERIAYSERKAHGSDFFSFSFSKFRYVHDFFLFLFFGLLSLGM